MSEKTDLFVVGGGPAGLAAAIAARLRGLSVMVADAARPPIDKACGEGLMPDSLVTLAQLGVKLDHAQSGFPFRGIRFHSPGAVVDATFSRGRARGVRRTLLHPLLVERAQDLGAELLWNTRVNGIRNSVVQLDGREVEARWIVGADGQHSRVRRWAGLDRYRHESKRFGFRRHYRVAPWSDYMEVHWGPGCQIYTTPVAPDEVCVALVSRDSHLHLDEALPRFPELTRRLEGACSTNQEKGAVSATRRLRRVSRGNVALVGDASGSVDAITGEGICLSFVQALALADALVSGRLCDYERAHRQVMRRPAMMGSMMLLLDRFPALRGRVLSALAARPAIFSQMLAMHVGDINPVEFFLDAIVPLGWTMLHS